MVAQALEIISSQRAVKIVILAIMLAVAFEDIEVAGYAQATGSRAEEEAIRRVIDAITEAFNRHDAEAWTRFATPDAQLVTVRGESMSGAAEIEKGLTRLFQTRNRNASLKTLDVKIRIIAPDVAIAYVTNELSGVVDPEGRTLPAQRELSLRVFLKNQGRWRITAFHNTSLQP